MNLTKRLFKIIHHPICRAYARHLGNRPADRFMRFLSSIEFIRGYGFWPNLTAPTRFSEKVWSRQLHERSNIFSLISDKIQVRDYVARKIGPEYLIPLLWQGTTSKDVPFDDLPPQFVLKANHGCGYNLIVLDKDTLKKNQMNNLINRWLNQNFGRDYGLGIAWAYKNINPQIFVEKLLEENGKVPVDYKFFCFAGKMEYFKIDYARFQDHSTRYFDRNITPLDLAEIGFKTTTEEPRLPRNFDEMVKIAEKLSTEFEFMRVDLYSLGSRIYFSELTPYPMGTSGRFSNEKYDYEFGKKWKS